MRVHAIGTRPAHRHRLLAGGPSGNTVLTATSGAVLLVLLAVEGVTIVFLRPLLSVHLFVGIHLIGHLASLPRAVRIDYGGRRAASAGGAPARRMLLACALLAGLVLALLVLPDFSAWLHYRQVRGHH